MFRVSTLDLENLPRNDQGKVDFDKDFFGKESFLTVSGQLNGETYACALSKIYTFGPTFRAENSNTSRHLAEFWMLEPEVAFANLNDVAEAWRKRCSSTSSKRYWKSVRTTCSSSPSAWIKTLSTVCSALSPLILPRWITPTPSPFWKTAANSSRTRCTGAWISPLSTNVTWPKSTSKRSVVVKNYPKDIKAFYMRLNEDGKTVAAMDVLAPGIGEIIGGSQREERLDVLDARMAEMGLNKEDYWWYRDLRRYGTVPHSGFGLGFERLIAYVTGVQNVRDVIPFPRTPRNATF
ncbi:amino acid--tRNA ligase-related protein [Klebsiella pneumoniae]